MSGGAYGCVYVCVNVLAYVCMCVHVYLHVCACACVFMGWYIPAGV